MGLSRAVFHRPETSPGSRLILTTLARYWFLRAVELIEKDFNRAAMPSRSCVELKGRPVKRFAKRSAGVKQGELGIAKSCVGSLSFFQLPVKFVHELGS